MKAEFGFLKPIADIGIGTPRRNKFFEKINEADPAFKPRWIWLRRHQTSNCLVPLSFIIDLKSKSNSGITVYGARWPTSSNLIFEKMKPIPKLLVNDIIELWRENL